jgi:hypothetical protein
LDTEESFRKSVSLLFQSEAYQFYNAQAMHQGPARDHFGRRPFSGPKVFPFNSSFNLYYSSWIEKAGNPKIKAGLSFETREK